MDDEKRRMDETLETWRNRLVAKAHANAEQRRRADGIAEDYDDEDLEGEDVQDCEPDHRTPPRHALHWADARTEGRSKRIHRRETEDHIVQATPPIARRLWALYVELLVLRREAASTRAVLRQWSGLDLADDGADADRTPAGLLAALADVVADVHERVADIAWLIGEGEEEDG